MKKYDSYIDSGIQWIGEIPSHWEVNKLKYIGNAIGGLTYSPNDIVEDESKGVLVLRSSNIQNGKLSLEDNVFVNLDISEKQTLRKGDILICSRNGSQHLIGKNICIDERTEGNTFGAFMMIFRSDNYKFLNHFFNSPIFTSQSGLFLTATINQLTSSTLNNFYLALPSSIEEQNTIANYLDQKTSQIDHLIAKKERLIQLLEEERTAIINQAVTKGLDPNVPMKDSGIEWLGEIPAHWEVKSFRFCIDILTDYTANGSFASLAENVTYYDSGYSRLVRLTDLRVDLSNEGLYVDEHAHNFLKKSELFGGEILIANVGAYAGLVMQMPLMEGKFTLGPNMFLVRLNQNTEFFLYQLNAPFCAEQLKMMAVSSAQPKLNKENIRQLKVVTPPIEEQNLIANHILIEKNRIETIITKTQQEIELLKEYKTALISEVVTGKVDVRDEKLN
jgi:type I restriction enzyme S subunit